MFDIQIINNEAVLFNDDDNYIVPVNLESLRDNNGKILYNLPDGSYVWIWSDNSITWLDSNGKPHRDGDMPTYIETNGYMQYCNHGEFHRIGGPACIWPNGREEYWIDGKYYTKKDYESEMADRNA